MQHPDDPTFQQPMPPYQDHKVLLVVFGILICLSSLACGCGGSGYMMFAGFALESITSQDPSFPKEMLPLMQNMRPVMLATALFYLALGAAFTWLGVGSCLCRRWARKLLEAMGWAWTAAMALALLNVLLFLPSIFGMMEGMMASVPSSPSSPPPPAGFGSGMAVMVSVIYVVEFLFAAVPGVILLLVYRMRSVRQTCDYRDPVARWTDKVPVPVLVGWIVLVGMAAAALLMLPAYPFMAKIYGMKIPSALGIPLMGGLGILLAFSAWCLSRMKVLGLWLAIGALAGIHALALSQMSHLDMAAMFREMGMPAKEMEEMAKAFSKPFALWPGMVLSGAVMTGFFLSLLRCFRQEARTS